MNQPVRVGLVFPRSGQQVFVYVPIHVAERVNAHHSDHKLHAAESTPPTGASDQSTSGNTTHA